MPPSIRPTRWLWKSGAHGKGVGGGEGTCASAIRARRALPIHQFQHYILEVNPYRIPIGDGVAVRDLRHDVVGCCSSPLDDKSKRGIGRQSAAGGGERHENAQRLDGSHDG